MTDDMPASVNNREKMMPSGQPRAPPSPKQLVGAYVPFARSTWIHPRVPIDDFDRVCKNIWSRAKEADEELRRGQSSPERRQNKDCKAADNRTSHRAEEQQKEADDFSLSAQYEEDKQQYHVAFTLPCPYLSGRRRPHVAKPERALSPVMEENTGNKQISVENSFKKICVSQSSSRRDKQLSRTEPQRPVCCESEDEKNLSSSSDSTCSDDDDFVPLPAARSCNTNSRDEERNEIRHSFDVLNSDSLQDSPFLCTEKDFLPPSTIKAGILPCPTRPPALGKRQRQRETPLSFHPHVIPTATLAYGVTAHAQAPVRGKAKASRVNLKNSAPPAAPKQQKAYDLLADFPGLQPPEKPLALGVLLYGNPKTKGAEGNRGITNSQNQCQERGASHQRRMENLPHEVSSICTGDQKSVLDLQTFGSTDIYQPRANNQPLPRVAAGTDGVDVNARTWASVAKAAMKQAAAHQEKARPCTFQQRVTINKAKAG